MSIWCQNVKRSVNQSVRALTFKNLKSEDLPVIILFFCCLNSGFGSVRLELLISGSRVRVPQGAPKWEDSRKAIFFILVHLLVSLERQNLRWNHRFWFVCPTLAVGILPRLHEVETAKSPKVHQSERHPKGCLLAY